MQKSLIYCRVSSERQKTEGHGLDSQEHRCREFSDQKGYEVEKVFKDSFSGGGDFMDRPAMSKLLAYVDKNPHTNYVVIFDDLKRFARDTVFHWKLRNEFSKRNAVLECLNHTFEDTPEGRFIETILASQGQLDREQNRRQVIQKMRARLELGYWPFAGLPTGYERTRDPLHGKLLKPTPKTSLIVKEALEGFASGRFREQEDVRKFLEEKDILNGKPVYLDFVKRMLTRVFYAGYVEHAPWEVSRRKGQHEALIDLATFERIQERLSGKTTTHVKNVLNEDFPLRSFVLCHSCRQPVTASWSTGGRGTKFAYYRCKTKGCIERNKSVKKSTIESEFELILAGIRPNTGALILTKAIVSDLWRKKEAEGIDRRKNIEKDIQKNESENSGLLKLMTRAPNENVISAYEKRIGEIVEMNVVLKSSLMSLDKHRPNIETALDIVFDFLKSPLKQWLKGDINTKKLVLRLVFEQNLAYNRKSGFETANLSLPLRVFTLPEAQKSLLVDLVSESWNQLHSWVFEASEAIINSRNVRNGYIYHVSANI